MSTAKKAILDMVSMDLRIATAIEMLRKSNRLYAKRLSFIVSHMESMGYDSNIIESFKKMLFSLNESSAQAIKILSYFEDNVDSMFGYVASSYDVANNLPLRDLRGDNVVECKGCQREVKMTELGDFVSPLCMHCIKINEIAKK